MQNTGLLPSLYQNSMMVWFDLSHICLLTILCVWRQALAQLPLYSTDIPKHEQEETIRELQKNLLNILGMKNRPNRARQQIKIPQYMMDLYKQQTEDPEDMSLTFKSKDRFSANVARSFPHIGTKTHKDNNNIVNLYFNMTDIPEDEKIVGAELHLHPCNSTRHRHRVNVYELVSSPHSVEEAITRLIDTQIISSKSSKHLLDITSAAQRWHSSPSKIHGIQVHVTELNGQRTNSSRVRLRRSTGDSDSDWMDERPLAVIYSQDSNHVRTKRSNKRKKNKRPGSKRVRSECQRKEMRVDFKAVGWEDWILAPQDYEAYYCHGECPFPLTDHLNATNHAIVQTLVSEVDPEAVPKPCCVPTDLSPISMLYVNGDSVVLKNYQDMVVEGCGCL